MSQRSRFSSTISHNVRWNYCGNSDPLGLLDFGILRSSFTLICISAQVVQRAGKNLNLFATFTSTKARWRWVMHPFSYKISQRKRLPSKFDGGQRWSMAWDGSIEWLQRIQKAAFVVDSIDLKQIWRPNVTWKHGFDGNAHYRGLTKQVSVDAIKFTFLYYNAWVL